MKDWIADSLIGLVDVSAVAVAGLAPMGAKHAQKSEVLPNCWYDACHSLVFVFFLVLIPSLSFYA